MKKVFVPSIDELYKMQDMGANVYKYLLVKTIETLVVDGINYPNKGMLKSAYKYFREDPYIAPAYGISLGSNFFRNDEFDRKSRVSCAINNYADTYGIPSYVGTEYLNKDILTTQSTEVKRLIKCIKHK